MGAPASCSPNCVSNVSALEGEGISANSGCHLAEWRSPQLLLRKCPGYTDKNLTTPVKILCYKPVPVLHCKCTLCIKSKLWGLERWGSIGCVTTTENKCISTYPGDQSMCQAVPFVHKRWCCLKMQWSRPRSCTSNLLGKLKSPSVM